MWSAGGFEGAELGVGTRTSLITLALIGNFALIWRRRYPVQVHGVILVCSLLVILGPLNDGLFGMAFSLYALGRYAAEGRVSLLGMLLALLVGTIDMFAIKTPDAGSVVALGFMALLWYIGRRLRFRGEYLRLLEGRAQYLEERKHEEAELAVAEERSRIARELHDIVAHQLSLMTVQAGAAKTVAAADPEAAHAAMEAVENAGRQALQEMRHLLHVLRRDSAGAELVPQPGYADLGALAAEVTAAGTEVRLHTEGRLAGLPPRVDLALYRIVQEGLTNVLKHAGGDAAATVVVTAAQEGVELSIVDDGHGASATPGRGYGIGGMRERAELLGGWLRAEPGVESGFSVTAFLPYGKPAA